MKKALGLSGLATLSSFYRVYQVSALQAMRARYGDAFITTRGFECMVEILYRAARLGLRISEVPMVLDGSRRVGKSKMKVLRTSLAYLAPGRARPHRPSLNLERILNVLPCGVTTPLFGARTEGEGMNIKTAVVAGFILNAGLGGAVFAQGTYYPVQSRSATSPRTSGRRSGSSARPIATSCGDTRMPRVSRSTRAACCTTTGRRPTSDARS